MSAFPSRALSLSRTLYSSTHSHHPFAFMCKTNRQNFQCDCSCCAPTFSHFRQQKNCIHTNWYSHPNIERSMASSVRESSIRNEEAFSHAYDEFYFQFRNSVRECTIHSMKIIFHSNYIFFFSFFFRMWQSELVLRVFFSSLLELFE